VPPEQDRHRADTIEGSGADPIEEKLEEARVGALVRRAGDHQHIGAEYNVDGDGGVRVVDRERPAPSSARSTMPS
jgi:hypothetical protein